MADHDAQIASIRDMRQRIGLLARKDKTVRFPTRKSRFAIRVTHLMAFPLRHAFRSTMQALFRLDHGAGREAIFAASVLTEFDQVRRSTYRPYDLVELLDVIAVPMRELRYIAPREGRLLLRDRVQSEGRIGDDPRAIVNRGGVPTPIGRLSY
jgi:hypothetical protein